MERGGNRPDEAAALPRVVSVLRAGGRTELPALSTERRPLSGRALQHRLLRPAHTDGGAGLRFETRHICPHLWRPASLPEPSRTGEASALPRNPPAAADE